MRGARLQYLIVTKMDTEELKKLVNDRKGLSMHFTGEICKVCGREQRIAWSIRDDLWIKIVPPKFRNKVVCLECFLKFADEKNINVTIDDFIFFGWTGENIKGCIIVDRA